MDACQQYHATHIAGTCPWCGQELFPHSPESTVTIRQRIGYDDQGEVAWREEEVVRDEAEPGGGEPGNPEERPLVRLLVLVVRESIRMGVTRGALHHPRWRRSRCIRPMAGWFARPSPPD